MGGNRPAQNCRFLLAGLIMLLVAFPFLENVARPLVLIVPVAVVFVAGVAVSDPGRLYLRRALCIAAIQIGLTGVSLLLPQSLTAYWISVAFALVATVILILFSTYCVLHYVLRAAVITRDQIYAGICMYVMLGFAFGAVFHLINILDPNSFTANMSHPDLMYFSFVTLATLGYGDITPRTNPARSLAIIEALVGMLYIAVFMARLVSLRANDDGANRSG